VNLIGEKINRKRAWTGKIEKPAMEVCGKLWKTEESLSGIQEIR
jgi:hypothetical protein